MNNPELEKILKSAPLPERRAEYWDKFPGRVMAETRRRGLREEAKSHAAVRVTGSGHWFGEWFATGGPKPALAFAAVLICLGLAFTLGLWKGRHSAAEPQLAELRKCFAEIKTLFPNQLRGIVFDQQGARLILADRPEVPVSPPLYVKICGPQGCQYFITFSGQQIQVNGDTCDVLLTNEGKVLLVGRQLLWPGTAAAGRLGDYRIEAKPLDTTS